MSQHFQVKNEQDIEILNDLDSLFIVVYKGTQADFSTEKAWKAWPECPTVFIRPAAGSWCGGFSLYRKRNGTVQMYCEGTFEYVVCCSAKAWGLSPDNKFGLETFDANGQIVFSTNYRFARITKIQSIPGPVVTTGGTIIQGVAAMSGWSVMPWINPSMASLTGAIVAGGGDLSYQELYLIQVNPALNELRMTIRDTIAYGNYLAGKTVYFPMGYIAGN